MTEWLLLGTLSLGTDYGLSIQFPSESSHLDGLIRNGLEGLYPRASFFAHCRRKSLTT